MTAARRVGRLWNGGKGVAGSLVPTRTGTVFGVSPLGCFSLALGLESREEAGKGERGRDDIPAGEDGCAYRYMERTGFCAVWHMLKVQTFYSQRPEE